MALTKEQLQSMYGMGAAGSMLGGGVQSLFGGNSDPSKGANKYLDQISGQTNQYFDPYFQAGKSQLNGLNDQYSQLMNDPGGKFNQIGQSFQQSPGFKFAMEQALKGSGNAAAAGGMAGSPQHEQQNMQLATDMANQDYYNYMQGATGLYGQGLTGGQNMANMGQQAGQSQADMIAQQLAQQAQMKYAGQASKNQSSPWGNIAGALGAFAGLKF